MAKGYVLYNPIAGTGDCETQVKALSNMLSDPLEYLDVTKIEDYSSLLASLNEDDFLIVAGGDGTLNRFINNTVQYQITQDILYFPLGSGNDFARELGCTCDNPPVSIKKYLQNLPSVEVNGKHYHFINGVGYGIDGYCCQVGDELRAVPGKKVDYTGIAIKGLLFHFSARNAKVTVDGQEYTYNKVWIAPTMYGKYYGGGMIPAPQQKRGNEHLTLMVLHDSSKLRTLMIFPSIFNGTITKNRKNVSVYCGKEITVTFDGPRPLQIDGETILDVVSYTAKR